MAWYTLASSIFEHCFKPYSQSAELINDEDTTTLLILSTKNLEKFASATLGRLDDTTDSVVASKIWSSALHLVSKYKVGENLKE